MPETPAKFFIRATNVDFAAFSVTVAARVPATICSRYLTRMEMWNQSRTGSTGNGSRLEIVRRPFAPSVISDSFGCAQPVTEQTSVASLSTASGSSFLTKAKTCGVLPFVANRPVRTSKLEHSDFRFPRTNPPSIASVHWVSLTVGSLAARSTALSGCWAGHVRWRDEEIEIALSRSPFPSRGHQLRCALVFPLSVELARHRGTALRARCDRDIRPEGSPVGTRQSDAGAISLARASLTGSKRRDASRVA